MVALVAADCIIDTLLTSVAAIQWEKEVLDRYMRRYITESSLGYVRYLVVQGYDSRLDEEYCMVESEPVSIT